MPAMSMIDTLILEVDNALRTLLPPKDRITRRASPALHHPDTTLSAAEKRHIAGLMRVNHAGEVCAQALYQGQALTAQLNKIKTQMKIAAEEEVDHLGWCEERLHELGSTTSLLNPLWYTGSLLIGALAGLAGDKLSLGFVAETEHQVTAHLQEHLHKIPEHDLKTKVILEQMQDDEEHHAQWAIDAGAMELPRPIKSLMSMVSKLMTRSSYYV